MKIKRTKHKKPKHVSRSTTSAIDDRHFGTEPMLDNSKSPTALALAYNWYSYFQSADDAKQYTLDYLKQTKSDKSLIKKVGAIEASELRNIGWNFRILTNGGSIPDEIETRTWTKLKQLAADYDKNLKKIAKDDAAETARSISIQERIKEKQSSLIAELDDQIDRFCLNTAHKFDVVSWFKINDIKPPFTKHIKDYYSGLYSELFDAVNNPDSDLKYAYKRWKRTELKKYLDFVKSIVSTAESVASATKLSIKPRAKKEKPAAQIVKRLKFKVKDDELGINSITPTDIVGAEQLWTYNTKTRALSVYHAIGPTGLTVKSTRLAGYDQKTSITKISRKPESDIKQVLTLGKVPLKTLVNKITTKKRIANGRTCNETLLLRIIK